MDNHHQQKEEQPYLLHDHLLHHHWPPLQGQQQQPLQHQHQLYLLNHQQQPVQQGIILHENSQNFLDSMPRGYRFCPTDEELIVHYLRKRIAKAPLPLNRIHEANVYGHNPQELTNRYRSDGFHNVNGWYFFTYLTNKYPKGSRPSRSCGDGGFWKPTGKDKKIYYNGNTVGYRKSLDFLLGPGEKTPWKMHEYRIHANNPKSDPVLCRLYMNIKRKNKDENEGDTVELMRENLDQCLTVNEAPMQNEGNDLAVGNISSASSANNQCLEYITSTLDTGGAASSNQAIYDLSSFQFPHHPFQDFQGYTNSHGGLEAITQSTQEFTEPFHLSKGAMMPSNLSMEPFHLSWGTMIPSDLNMEDVSKYAIGGTDLSNLPWQNGCAGDYVNMTSLKIDGENSGNK